MTRPSCPYSVSLTDNHQLERNRLGRPAHSKFMELTRPHPASPWWIEYVQQLSSSSPDTLGGCSSTMCRLRLRRAVQVPLHCSGGRHGNPVMETSESTTIIMSGSTWATVPVRLGVEPSTSTVPCCAGGVTRMELGWSLLPGAVHGCRYY